jgi:thiopurine S-methyltransferase
MDAEFWQRKWERNEIGFHEGRPNALLVKHLASLSLQPGARLFLPLCGKTRDMAWLLSRGFQVAGSELCAVAVEQLFDELEVAPESRQIGSLTRYRAASRAGSVDLEVFQGDVFDLSAGVLGHVDLVYDRAALVALPEATRRRYAASLIEMSEAAGQLLICFEYDQSAIDGPPFSVAAEEVHGLYDDRYDVTALETLAVDGGLKGVVPATETIWRLRPR